MRGQKQNVQEQGPTLCDRLRFIRLVDVARDELRELDTALQLGVQYVELIQENNKFDVH